jgi:hypothetical protein
VPLRSIPGKEQKTKPKPATGQTRKGTRPQNKPIRLDPLPREDQQRIYAHELKNLA